MTTQRLYMRGFLPTEDPLHSLPEELAEWEQLGAQLSKLALSRYIRPIVGRLPPFDTTVLRTTAELERAMSLLSYISNMYVFAPNQRPAQKLPPNLAKGWHETATRLSRPPMLTYASQTLYNWRRIDPAGPVAVGNLTLLQNFLGGMDEEWFVTIHINIEAEAGRAISIMNPLHLAVLNDNTQQAEAYLLRIAQTLEAMHRVLSKVTQRCDPYIYFHRIRPFMFGWRDNPNLPNGMLYSGVSAYKNQSQHFRGETGAQSSVLPAMDAVLGISHEYDSMREYLDDMRNYMPREDHLFIERLEQGPSVRNYVARKSLSNPSLRDAYNVCIDRLVEFRQLHIEFAAKYILAPAAKARKESGEVGTGGTPFTVYLKKHIHSTLSHRL